MPPTVARPNASAKNVVARMKSSWTRLFTTGRRRRRDLNRALDVDAVLAGLCSAVSFSARVEMEATSLPARGSEIVDPQMASPEARSGSQRSFCSSVPNSRMASLPNAVSRMLPAMRGRRRTAPR